MPFAGPFTLSGDRPVASQVADLRRMIPGIQSITSYPGAGGVGTAALGYQHSGPLLFQGQPPSTLDALLASPPRLVEGVNVQPESITGALSGGTTPTLGIARSDSIGGDPSGVGGVSGVGSTGAASSSGAGMPSGFFADIADAVTMGSQNSPIGQAVNAVGVPGGLQGLATAAVSSAANTAVPGLGVANLGIGMLTETSPSPAMTQGLVQAANQLVDVVNAPPSAPPAPAPAPTGPTPSQIASAMGLSGHLGDTGVGKQFALEQGLRYSGDTNAPAAPGIPGLTDLNTSPDPSTEGAPGPTTGPPGLTDLNTMPDPDTGGGGPGDGK